MEIENHGFSSSLGASQSVLGLLLFAGALFLFRTATSSGSLKHIPLVAREPGTKETGAHESDVLAMGYKKFKSIFRINTPEGVNVVIPTHLMDEIKARSEDDLDSVAALDSLVLHEFTKVSSTSPMMNHLVKSDLTASLTRINPRLAKTAAGAVASEFPACEDWTSVNFFEVLLRVVAIVSGDIFLGPELCRNEEYLHLSIRYTVDAFTGIFRLKTWRKWLRPIGVYFVPELKIIEEHRRRVKLFLGPIIKARREAMSKPGYEAPDDLLQWTLKKAPKFDEEIKSDDDIAMMQLRLSLAAIHTTSTTGGMLMRDICSQPGLVKALREEIETVIKNQNGAFSTKALYEMRLLDSVMKESQRLHMLGPNMFHTITRRGFTLSDGTYIPPKTLLTSATLAAASDPENFPNPETFDPYRFVKLRQRSEEEAGRHQFVTLSKDLVPFGWGRHACPGRFFAANEIKLIMISVFRKYDVELRGEELFFKRVSA